MRCDPDEVNLILIEWPSFECIGPSNSASHWTASPLSWGPKLGVTRGLDASSLVS
jgi:hypothetical protein